MKKKQFGCENADDWPMGAAIFWSSFLIFLTFIFASIGA
jgi:hypothetical protein